MTYNMTYDMNDKIVTLSAGHRLRALRYVVFLMMVMLMGTTEAWGQPVEITTDEDIANDTKKLYLIQTNGFQSFYIVPQANNTITTNNILGDYMLWYFLDAGTVSGTQYYYIVNNSTGKYICHGGGTSSSDASRGVTLVEKTSDNEERCKFYIELDESNGTTGFYNIDAKDKPSYYGLNKRNGSQTNQYPIRLTNAEYIHDFNSKWKFIRFNGTFTWPAPPFTPSTDSDKHYYEIQNYQKQTYYASTDATPDKVTFTNQTIDRRAWYFKEASSDTWFKYYYIVNPATGGKYMYYTGTATNGSNQTNAVSVKTYTDNSENEDRYQFVVVQAARGDMDKGVDVRKTCYAIIPKLLVGNLWSSNSLGLAEGNINDGAKMGIINSRGANNSAQWDFKSTAFPTVCGNPVITFDRTTGKATITTTTSWPSIYYTTDGTPPSSTNGTLYEEPFSLTEQTTIKAIVTKDGYTDSEVTTTTIYKVAAPTIQQETGTHNISITTTTPGATIYYTTDNSIPTTSSTQYTGPSEELGGKPIKAIAVKDGMINSDIGEGTVSIKCATPVISFNNATSKVSITCETVGSTIHYTTDGSTPTESSPEYETSFSVTSPTTVKAIATHETEVPSDVAELVISKVVTPTIQDNGSNAISITTTTPDATIYFTTDGSTPTTSSTVYSSPLTDNVSNKTIKAIAVKENMINSAVGDGTVMLQCATPVITRNGLTFTLSCSMPTDANLYYTLEGGSEVAYPGTPVPFTSDQLPITVTAVARHSDYTDSETASMTLLNGAGTPEDPYLIYGTTDLTNFVTNVNNGTAASSACYKLCFDVSASDMANIAAITTEFTGTFDGGYHIISGLSHPLFNTINGGTVKNVVIANSTVSGNGAICNEADGATKIYNCGVLSGSIIGSGNVGGLVGHIASGSSVRVVNCYNFATVSGGTTMAGIVGNNEGTVGDVRIALCMMYGNMSGGTSPIYAGNHISNASNFTEYNYWRSKANLGYTTYNDQLAIDKDEYLTRFPFYRHILNTHRELAAYFLFAENTTEGSVGDISQDNINEIGHWVLDKDKADYPIIEKWETNTRKVLDAPVGSTVSVRKGDGSPITSLKVKVIIGSNTYTKIPGTETDLTLPITDMDEENYDYTWGKVVLPFANEFEVNTNYSKICTGWMITGITGGTEGNSFDKYDVSDRDCTSKDLYSTTGFIFAQGGYYIVPYNVTAIEITANFATAYYLRDAAYDIGYSGDNSSGNSGYINRKKLGGDTPTTYHDKTVYNTLASALSAMSASGSTHEQAVVLIGNYHQDSEGLSGNASKGYTIMSIDADNNQEPDYAIYSNFTTDRPAIPPTRFDFVAMIPVGMSAHIQGSQLYPNIPIFKPRGWFEVTETSLLRADQFELESNNFNTSESDTRNYRCIINGGYFTQMVRGRFNPCTKVSYFQIGGNAYIKEFYPGNHSKNNHANKLVPINVTGGEVEQCFMTGYGLGTAYGPDIYFWCAGGKIGKFLGAYMEKPRQTTSADGNVNLTAKIDHAVIGRFFGGGTSPNARVTGNINVTINNSRVDFYCGGPEFGDMSDGKTVRTEATNTYFKEYYGAGFGGTGITYTNDKDDGDPITNGRSYRTNNFNDCYVASSATDKGRLRFKTNYGLGSCYKFEFVIHSRGHQVVSRFFTGYAKFSLATTGNVTNVLNGCEIEKDFYGAGCQGKVNGSVTSELTGCTIHGSAFGGGFKAESNQVDVYPATQPTLSKYNSETCLFSDFGTVAPETYEWVQGTSSKKNVADEDHNKLYTGTDVTMTDLGNVTGAISLTIDGGSVTNNVFGGGNESKSLNNTTVNILGNAQIGTANSSGDVYGGGNVANVGGNTKVILLGGTVNGDVYGGGKGRLEVGTSGEEGYVSPIAATVNATTVYLNGMEKEDYDATEYGGLGLTQATTNDPWIVGDNKKGSIVKGSIFGCNNLNGTPLGGVKVHVYGTQHADKDEIREKFGIKEIDEVDEELNLDTNRKKLQYWIDQAERNGVDEETINTAKGYLTDDLTTANLNAQISNLRTATVNSLSSHHYDVHAVYGGGNLAAYVPTDLTNGKTQVIIDGCGRTSIQQVYGGGNAASTPATEVTVNGTYEVEELFGGGNGKDALPDGSDNPGANVGFKDYSSVEDTYNTKEKRQEDAFINEYVYGSGKASVNIFGGKIHRVFGGSNTKGNVRQTAVTMLDERSTCDFQVDEAYGGGKSAPMDAEAKLLMACIPGLKQAYGGAEAADIQGNVELNITNGTFDRVFGGNNESGTIRGSITVNIEEVGCKPIIIGELYGGGNLAGYSVYGYKEINEGTETEPKMVWKPRESATDSPAGITLATENTPYADPQVNVKSFTSIGNIYGGGYGTTALMVGNPTVEINEVEGEFQGKDDSVVPDGSTTPSGYPIPAHAKNTLGTINNVFGGGNAAAVNGNTTVKIGTRDKWTVTAPVKVDGVTQYETDGVTPKTEVVEKDVVGANIVGNVYGGGNEAEVTGSTNVTIGKETTTTTTSSPAPPAPSATPDPTPTTIPQ